MYFKLFHCLFSGSRALRRSFRRAKKIAWKFINYTPLFIDFRSAVVKLFFGARVTYSIRYFLAFALPAEPNNKNASTLGYVYSPSRFVV